MRPWCYFCLVVDDSLPYYETLDIHVCDKCKNKVQQALNKDMSMFRVSNNFRAILDGLRNSTTEDFELRNKILNTLWSKNVTTQELLKFKEYGLKTMGLCIGGKPRKFSVSNIVDDVISINKNFLLGKYNIDKLLEDGFIVKVDLIENKYDYEIDIKLLGS